MNDTTLPHYEIAKLAINEKGEYLLIYVGEVGEQGGTSFGYGHMYLGTETDTVIDIMKQIITKNHDEYIKLAKKKTE